MNVNDSATSLDSTTVMYNKRESKTANYANLQEPSYICIISTEVLVLYRVLLTEQLASTVQDFWEHTIRTTKTVTALPVNMLDPIRKHFGYGQLWPLRPVCSLDQARSYLPDLTSHILFSSIFPKETWIILYKADPDLIWVALSGFGKTHLVWKQVGVQEPSGPVSGRTQLARYQFSHFQTRFRSSTDGPAHSVQNWPGYDLVLADSQLLAEQIPSGSKPACKNHLTHFWPILPSRSGSDVYQFRHVYWASTVVG